MALTGEQLLFDQDNYCKTNESLSKSYFSHFNSCDPSIECDSEGDEDGTTVESVGGMVEYCSGLTLFLALFRSFLPL